MFGSELEFYLFRERYADAHAKRLPRPHALGCRTSSTTTFSRTHLRRAADPPDPQRHARRRASPSRARRARPGRGSTRSTSATRTRSRWPTTTSSTRTAPRRSRTSTGCAITFMAKPDETGSAARCHVHSSLWRDGENAFARRVGGCSGSSSPARSPACAELAIFLAPTVNSYKRFAAGSWAPTTLAWGRDNRTCGFRVVGARAIAAHRDAHPRRRREPLPRLRGAARCRPARHRERARAAAARSRATPTSPTPRCSRRRSTRRSRRSRADRRAGCPRRRGRRPLPSLRAYGAAPLRRGRDGLRAAANLRARIGGTCSPPTQEAAGPLSLEQLETEVRNGTIESVVLALVDMQGRLVGQARAERLLRRACTSAHRRVQLPPDARHGVRHDARLHGVEHRARLSRLPLHPDLATLRRMPWHAETALVLADPRWHDGHRSPSRRDRCWPAGRARPRAGLRADDELRARVLRLPRDVRPGSRGRLPR